MCSIITCGITSTVLGVILVVASSVISFVVVPGIVDTFILNEVQLKNDSVAMERFEAIPFPLHFKVRVFNVTNPDTVQSNGVPIVTEIGPYVYRIQNRRIIEGFDEEEDIIKYHIREVFEFDSEASYPYTEDDIVTVVNIPYHGILQMAEKLFPNLMFGLSIALNGIFGENNGPFMTVRVGDLFFDGISLCKNPGLVSYIACGQIRNIGASVKNLVEEDDGSLTFSLFDYKQDKPTKIFEIYRGIEDHTKLGIISAFNGSSYLDNWVNPNNINGETNNEVSKGICNMINGSDSTIFPPFVDRDSSLYALNLDVCRSVELRYQYDTEYEGIPVARFATNEWFLDNDEGCFCVNQTAGLTRENGCLLRGAQELFSCVGAFLVLSYPHFLFADDIYRNGVLGMNPILEDHRIYADLEPHTGTVVRGNKRAQFNLFLKPISSIAATSNLRVTLAPLFWVEEGSDLPEDYADMIRNRLLQSLNLLSIFIPIIIALCGVLAIVGVILIICGKKRQRSDSTVLVSEN